MKKDSFLILLLVFSFLISSCSSNSSRAVNMTETVYVSDEEEIEYYEPIDPRELSLSQRWEIYSPSFPDFKFEWQDTPESTMCSEIGYDSFFEVLAIRFRNTGNLYIYYAVPFTVWDDFSNTDSKGSYFNTEIKDCYDYECIG